MDFQGFDPTAVAELAKLPTYNEKKYKAAKALLDDGLRKPGLALISELSTRLNAELAVSPRASVSPLHRDLRFAKAGTPRYKDHFMLTTWTGADKKTAPTLWLRLSSTEMGFASGIGFTPEIRDRFREAVAGKAGAQLEKALAQVTKKYKKNGVEVAGDQLKKVPRPYPADHPREALLRRNGLQVRFMEPLPSSLSKAAFSKWCERRLTDLLGVHEWLVTHVG